MNGQTVRLAGAFQDITEQRRLQAELLAASDRVRDLYDNAPCGYHSLDAQGCFLHVNATELAWLGCTRDELIGRRRVTEFLSPEGLALFERHFSRLIASGRVEGLEFDLVPQRGAGRRVNLTATAIYDEHGQYVMSRTVMFDITELHRVRQDLHRLVLEQSAMLDNELVGMVRVRDRRFVWVNRGMARMFGYATDELVGMPTVGLYADADEHLRVGAGIGSASRSGQTYRTQVRMLRKDGSEFWIDLSSVQLGDAPVESLALFVDITPLKDAEAARIRSIALDADNAQLRETDRLKDEFLANMSHELRTPLNAVIAFSQLLLSGAYPTDSPKYVRFVTQIGSSGRHLLQLIDSMLDYAKARSERIELHAARVDLTAALQEVVDMLQPKWDQRQVSITLRVDEGLSTLVADPMRLRQVLLNLLDNAIKFSRVGGQVQVHASDKGSTRLCIEIEDQGIGIASADLTRLFTKFEQLSAGDRKAYPGTGMGLAVVRQLVEALGGEVGVRSTLGVGSVFHVTLPWQLA